MQSKLYLIFLTFKIYKWDRTTIRYVLSQICIRNIVISWFKSWGQEVWNKWLFCSFSINSVTKDTGWQSFRLCQGWSGTHTIFDRIGILSSRTSSAYSLCNKIKFPDVLLWYILSCSYSINSSTKDPGGQNSHYLTDESEFCPPEHTQNEVCCINSDFLPFVVMHFYLFYFCVSFVSFVIWFVGKKLWIVNR